MNYKEQALIIIDILQDRHDITIRQKGILRRAILENKPKKGKWIVDDEDEIYMWCNQCEQGKRYSQSLYVKKTNFCPDCGADMRGD